MAEPHLTLFSADLLSKWGFWDGTDPDAWMDYCDAEGIDWFKLDFPIAAVVRSYLVPALDQDVTVVDIETSHNPIRVETIRGEDVTDYWRRGDSRHLLTPESVDVPMADLLRLALTEAGLTEPPRYTPPLAST
ncbi:hypothetical protein ABZ723_15745 [Streptomyces sp. NPDC006700]|uniref:hypothetical protein n=1 Tax=Streptomyces sp. NPDC006700 TaxID=3154479 RepID=UPI0033CB4EB3